MRFDGAADRAETERFLRAVDDLRHLAPSSSVCRRSSYRSLQSIREINLFPTDAIADLHAIASRMAAAGYGRECVQVYASVRKPTVDFALRRLGVEKLSIGDVQRLDWDALEAKIHRWIRTARAAVRGIFASECRLCFHIFHDLPLCTSTATATVADDAPFAEAIKGAAL
ncbi:exocyst complex component EXO70B1-like [Miscanthus floridulus]|uniref:exocyst complex component EXO70B1-like n=1 Tax=Miscanthus floridulus TaxID=154761 RepID=UPI003457CC6B